MKYYIVSDVHGFYSEMVTELLIAGYYDDKTPHKLVILGDCFDRGSQAEEMQDFLLDCLHNPNVILVKGNHEDLFEDFVLKDFGKPKSHHVTNGTFETALQLTGIDLGMAQVARNDFVRACMITPYYRMIIPAMIDYYETKNYIFVHGYIPVKTTRHEIYSYRSDWREASPREWRDARWYNGMQAARTAPAEKTVVCGHFHTSFGHSRYENDGPEFGQGSNFKPYYGDKVIGIDSCVAYSKYVNCLVLEDEELEDENEL